MDDVAGVWDGGLDVCDCVGGFGRGARGEVYACRAVGGEVCDCLFAQACIAFLWVLDCACFAGEVCFRTASHQHDFALQTANVRRRRERLPHAERRDPISGLRNDESKCE